MSGTINRRAMVFTGEPQDIDVYDGARWVPGSMLGWRHENDGPCRIMVRFTANSVAKTAWASLEDVRLPQRHPVRVPGAAPDSVGVPSPARDRPYTQPLPIGRSLAGREDEFERSRSSTHAARPMAGGPGSSDTTDHPRRRRTDARPGREVWELAEAGVTEAGSSGRHRAPSAIGGHRAENETPRQAAPELLTRPISLAGAVPQPRNTRHDGYTAF